MMQPALDHPVAPLEPNPARRVQLLQGQAANQIHRLGALFSMAPYPSREPRDQSRAGKTHLLGRDLPAFQQANFTPAAIDFPPQRAGLRRGPRGKISPASTTWLGFAPVPSGCL